LYRDRMVCFAYGGVSLLLNHTLLQLSISFMQITFEASFRLPGEDLR
jgi:hypothetical protein